MKHPKFHSNFLYGLFGATLLLVFAPEAHAVRVANFNVIGTNTLGVNGASQMVTGIAMSSNCSVTVTNNSTVSQKITYNINLVSSAAAFGASPITQSYTRTVTLAPANSVGDNCTASSSTCTFPQPHTAPVGQRDELNYAGTPAAADGIYSGGDFISLVTNGTPQSETVICEGFVTVLDTAAGSPGFVTASGLLSTYTESSSGVALNGTNATSRSGTALTSETSFVLGEGRPF